MKYKSIKNNAKNIADHSTSEDTQNIADTTSNVETIKNDGN